jgi:hypothetical protein
MCLGIASTIALTSQVSADDFIIGEAQAAVGGPKYRFSIPHQSLESALDAFRITTGVQIFYNSALTEGRTSPGATGMFTVEGALRALLTGTSLAPVVTAPGALTLVLDAQSTPLASEATPPRAPVLSLDTLRVEVPVVRGYEMYAATVRYAIQTAIRNSADLREKRYRAGVNVWVSPSGMIQHSEILESTGDRTLDIAINQIVLSVAALESPPNNLPQPVHVRILAGGAP